MTSPTLGEFQRASIRVNVLPDTPPLGMTAFESDGKPMAIADDSTGLYGRVWETGSRKLMITFMGVNPIYGIGRSEFLQNQVESDVKIFTGNVAPIQTKAAAFARSVEQAAAAAGIPKSDIYTTGVSLGGAVAQYVAQQTGMGGVAFVPAATLKDPAKPERDNFINIVSTGDPWAMVDSEFEWQSGLSTTAADGTPLTHYGKTWVYGDPLQNTLLKVATKAFFARENLLSAVGLGRGTDVKESYMRALAEPLSNPAAAFNYGLPGLALTGLLAVNHLGWVPAGLTDGDKTIEQLNAEKDLQ